MLLLFILGCGSPMPASPTVSILATEVATVTAEVPPTETPPSPGATATGFLNAWSEGDYAAMYVRLSPESRAVIDEAGFTRRYQDAMVTATVITVTTHVRSALQEGAHARVAFDLRLETALVGELVTDTVMSLSLYEDQWWVDWDAGLIWPHLAGGNYFRMDYVTPVRANIYDRNGLGLAVEGKIVTVGVIPGQIQDEPALLAALAQVTGLSTEQIQSRYASAPADWRVPIAEIPAEVSVDQNALLSSIAGIYRDEKNGRLYPGASAPHVIGWVSPVPAERLAEYRALGYRGDEWVGIMGLEAWGESILAGQRGGALSVVTPAGEVVAEVAKRPAEPSRAITTTIDREFQRKVQQILGGRRGAIVVLDAQTGAVLAMASGPGFDTNVFAGPAGAAERSQILSNPANPLFNRATHGTYPSASVFKIVTMSAALERAGMSPTETIFHCPGYWEGLGPGARKVCWDASGHGDISLEDGLTASCDVVFYSVGQILDELDPHILGEMARAFGLGERTGLVGISEEPGLVPDPEWKVNAIAERWWIGDTINLSIGQGYLLVTPLQIARMLAAVGNGGALYRPYVIERIAGNETTPEQVTQPEVAGQLPLTRGHLQAIQQALLGVTADDIGTAWHRYTGLSISVAGKTGTAEAGGPESIPHSWFAAYAPAENPEIAIAVIVERGGEGSTVAAPLTRQVVEAYYGLPLSRLPREAEEGYVTPTPGPTPGPEGTLESPLETIENQ